MANLIKRNPKHTFLYLDHYVNYSKFAFQKGDVVFATIRNPCDHIQSLYSHSTRLDAPQKHLAVSFANVVVKYGVSSFDEFWKRYLNGDFEELYSYAGGSPFYFHRLFRKNGALIPHEVLWTDTLTEEFPKFLKRHGLKFEPSDFHVDHNESKAKNDKFLAPCARERLEAGGSLITEEMKHAVEKAYSKFYSFFSEPSSEETKEDGDTIKICHLIWDNSPMSFLNACTLWSFKRWNPDWDVYIWHIDAGLDKPWLTHEHREAYKGPCYFDRVAKDATKVIRVKPSDIRKGVKSSVHLSDILRIQLMHRIGGLYADFDIMFTGPLPLNLKRVALFINIVKMKGRCVPHFPVALFYSPEPGLKIWKDVLHLGNSQKGGAYQKFGVALFHQLFHLDTPVTTMQDARLRVQSIFPHLQFDLWRGSTYLPVPAHHADHLFRPSGSPAYDHLKSIEDTERCFGIHWFCGAKSARAFLNKNDLDESIMSHYCKEFLSFNK